MKKILTITGLAVGLSLVGMAATPSYTSLSAGGNATAGAAVNFPSSRGQQLRLVSVQWQSDTNNGALQFSTGAGAYSIIATNAATTTTSNAVNTTAGLVANSTVILEHLGTCYVTTIASTNGANGMILASGGWGVLPSVGDSVYQMGTASTVTVGATTNWQNGEALYVGDPGRPVRVVLTPASTTNRLNSVSGRYQ